MSERNSTSAAAEQNATESWHVYSEADTLQRLNVGESGLTGKEAAERLMRVGESPYDQALDLTELAAYTAVSNGLLQLDETITRN